MFQTGELSASSIVVGIYGEGYTGKTQLASTLREPIAFFHHSSEPSSTLESLIKTRDIRVHVFGLGVKGRTREDRSESASLAVEPFVDDWIECLSWAKTIVLDTETGLWELLRLKYFGGESPQKFKGMDSKEAVWADINGEWRMLFIQAKSHNIDVVVISKHADKYKNNKVVGIKSRGQKDIPGWCDIILHTSFVQADDVSNNSFCARLMKAGPNYRMTGVPLTNTTLPQVLSLIYGNSEDDWQ